ncbi:hypothetical protein [Kitasatospora sp. NPDC057015]|uniref:hypothetical protein n=1 Tax=Kitasatospora sp. NPDC057015 TaxID=3346001 RepID=UPI00363558F2
MQALGAHLRGLRESTGLSMAEYLTRQGEGLSDVSAYENGERLPRKAYLDTLHGEVERSAGAQLTPDVRRLTHTLYRNALPAKGSVLTDLYDSELRKEELAYKVEAAYLRAQDLQYRNEQLQARVAAGGAVHPDEGETLRREGVDLLREKGELIGAQQEVQRRIEHLERLLPPVAAAAVVVPPRPSAPPVSYGPSSRPAQPNPSPWWPVPPAPQPAPRGKAGRRVPWILVGVLTVAVGLLAGVVLRPVLLNTAAKSDPTQSPSAQSTVTVTAPAAAPATPAPPAASAAPSAPGAGPSSPPPSVEADSSGWAVSYRDTAITMPQVDGPCQGANMDFEPPKAGPRNDDDANEFLVGHDLKTQNACFTLNATAVLVAQVKRWGTASEQAPTAGQCLDQASRQALGESVTLSQVHIGSAYCLVTQAGSLVWFKVTAKPGIDHQGLTVAATLWTQSTR